MVLAAWMREAAAATPARCEVCHAWPAEPVCAACRAQFAQPRHRCRLCALALPEGATVCGRCAQSPPPLDACHAAVSYAYPWSVLVSRFKFAAQPGWAGAFAGLMLDLAAVREAVAAARWLVPMPLSRERLAARGFNQAHELARRLAPGKAEPRLALRVRDTAPQAGLDRAARLSNLRQAFMLEPARAAAVLGQRVVLVDDVMTSGASLFALAQVFRTAGAAQVAAVVLARTED
jgi:ComF family protein